MLVGCIGSLPRNIRDLFLRKLLLFRTFFSNTRTCLIEGARIICDTIKKKWLLLLAMALWFWIYRNNCGIYLFNLLCRLRSIAAHGDHFLRRLLSGSHTFLVVTHSYVPQATHTFLGMLPLFFAICFRNYGYNWCLWISVSI